MNTTHPTPTPEVRDVQRLTASAMQTLISLMAIPSSFNLEAIVKTSDGFYIGRKRGDLGYNLFIGQPSKPHAGCGRDLILKRWSELDSEQRAAVIALAQRPVDGSPIDLQREFGIPQTT